MARRALGRGLDALIPGTPAAVADQPQRLAQLDLADLHDEILLRIEQDQFGFISRRLGVGKQNRPPARVP